MKVNLMTLITSLFLTITLLLLTVFISINFRPLYYFDIHHLNITKDAQISTAEIKENYNAVIDFLNARNDNPLTLPTLPISKDTQIHFQDVKNLLTTFGYAFIVSLLFSIIGISLLYKKKNYYFYRLTSFLLIIIPIGLIIPFFTNFDELFTWFHKMFFNNQYWEMDPNIDPVINIFPETYFLHAALMILILVFIESFIMNYLYRFNLKRFFKKINEKK